MGPKTSPDLVKRDEKRAIGEVVGVSNKLVVEERPWLVGAAECGACGNWPEVVGIGQRRPESYWNRKSGGV